MVSDRAGRFIGNKTNTRLPTVAGGHRIETNERQKMALMLDVRTFGRFLNQEDTKEAVALLQGAYIGFYVQFYKYEREKQRKKKEANKKKEGSDTAAAAAAGTKKLPPQAKKRKASSLSNVGLGSTGTTYTDAPQITFGMIFPDDAKQNPTAYDSSDDEVSEDDQQTIDAGKAKTEFMASLRNWFQMKTNWKEHYPEENIPTNPDLLVDLMKLDIGRIYRALQKEDPRRRKYGFLPYMASCSIAQLGALNAESYAERVNSAAKLIMTDANTLLDDEEVGMLVLLRMNESFMRFMRENYHAQVTNLQQFGRTVVEDGSEEDDDEEED
jgi:hypothetical protein